MRIIQDKAPARLPLGMRHNNPFNIFHTDRDGDGRPDVPPWQGAALVQPHKEVVAFADLRSAMRAGARLVRNYQLYHKIRTIDGVVNRYAPAADKRNHTQNYIAFVARETGFGPTQKLDFTLGRDLLRVIAAIVIFEQGYQPFTSWEYVRAVEDAGVGVDL